MKKRKKNLKKRLKLGDVVKYKHSNRHGLLVKLDYDRFTGEYEGYVYYWCYPPQIINLPLDEIELVHAI
jgi:hypothetical protein